MGNELEESFKKTCGSIAVKNETHCGTRATYHARRKQIENYKTFQYIRGIFLFGYRLIIKKPLA